MSAVSGATAALTASGFGEAQTRNLPTARSADGAALPTSVQEAANPLDFKPEELSGRHETARAPGRLRFGTSADESVQ